MGRKEWRNCLDNRRKRICWFEIVWICRCPEEWNWYILAFVFLFFWGFSFFFLFFFIRQHFCHLFRFGETYTRPSEFSFPKSQISNPADEKNRERCLLLLLLLVGCERAADEASCEPVDATSERGSEEDERCLGWELEIGFEGWWEGSG